MGSRIAISTQLKDQVEALAGHGLRDIDISGVLGIGERTMQRRCRWELTRGRALAKSKLAETAYQMALSGRFPAMTIFLCKTQLGWREKDSSARPEDEPRELEPLTKKVLPGLEAE